MRRGSRGYSLSVALGGIAVAWLLRALGATWRLRLEGANPFAEGKPFAAALWHRGLFIAAYAFRDRAVVVPVSRSRDGDRIEAVLTRLGYGPAPRGSSSRGATSVLTGLIRAVRRGHPIALLCDGPRGPARRAKPGPLAVARATGVPIWPLGLAARPAFRFGSWDEVVLPLPFARAVCTIGPPLHVPRNASREEIERLRGELEAHIDRLDREAAARLGLPPPATPAPGETSTP